VDNITKALFDGTKFKRGSVVFYHSNYPGDILIRLGSGSYFSHVAVAQGDGSAVCAWQGGAGMPSGVINVFQDYNATFDIEARTFPGDAEALLKEMNAQLGKPYDYCGLLANPIWNIFRVKDAGGVPDAFHCSSLVAYAWSELAPLPARIAGKPFRAITPQDVYNVLS
jgi:cell wall-associated NlpC family hydrolase